MYTGGDVNSAVLTAGSRWTVLTQGHAGQFPECPRAKGLHDNLWMMCIACFLMLKH